MQDFDHLISRVRESGEKIDFAGPQSPQAVQELEKALGVELPASYRSFLLSYGAGGTVGSWIAGIYDNAPLKANDGYAYGETMRIRKDYGLPASFVVIQSAAPEVVWCLDLRKVNAASEAPVVAVDVLNGFRTDAIASDFRAFFREYLEARTEPH